MADPKQIARRIFQKTLASIDIPLAMERKLVRAGRHLQVDNWNCELSATPDVRIVAIGKATHAMLRGFSQAFPDLRVKGVASAPTAAEKPIAGVSYFLGGHPIPTDASFDSARAALSLLQGCSEETLVVFLLSGGGSALMEVPLNSEQSLEDTRTLNQYLVTCGASIQEINAIRKHTSAIKGGRLAVAAGKARKLTLAITDVPHGEESALASGPTIPDPTTVTDAVRYIHQYRLRDKLPKTVMEWFSSSNILETPKANHPAFENSHFSLLLTSHDLFHAAHRAAEEEGFITCCDNTTDDWPLERAVDYLLGQLDELRNANPGQRVALISDGEVSSAVRGKGIGGRNSALVLACVEKIAEQEVTVLSAGTDGIDGNSPGAGAVADGMTLQRAIEMGISAQEFFNRSDAFSFFEKLGDAIVTGPTGNNLRDLRIFLAHG